MNWEFARAHMHFTRSECYKAVGEIVGMGLNGFEY